MLVLQGETPVVLLCWEAASMMKEYNSRRRFDTEHGAKYAKYSLQEKHKLSKNYKADCKGSRIYS